MTWSITLFKESVTILTHHAWHHVSIGEDILPFILTEKMLCILIFFNFAPEQVIYERLWLL